MIATLIPRRRWKDSYGSPLRRLRPSATLFTLLILIPAIALARHRSIPASPQCKLSSPARLRKSQACGTALPEPIVRIVERIRQQSRVIPGEKRIRRHQPIARLSGAE
jgi:hypothetical protein